MNIKKMLELARNNNQTLNHYSKRLSEKMKCGNPVVNAFEYRKIILGATLAVLITAIFIGNIPILPPKLPMGFALTYFALTVSSVAASFVYAVKYATFFRRYRSTVDFINTITRLENTLQLEITQWPIGSEYKVESGAENILTFHAQLVKQAQSFAWRKKEADRLRVELRELHRKLSCIAPVKKDWTDYFACS